MQEFVYTVKPVRLKMVTEGPTTEEGEILEKHYQYLVDLTVQKVVVLFGRTQNQDEKTFGLVIFRSESEAQARQLMNNDPAVTSGIMTAELFPYKIAGMSQHKV